MALAARNITDSQNYATTQTAEGRYVAVLNIDNASNCPLRRKLHLTGYSIPEPNRIMRNIPKFYAAKDYCPDE